MAARQFRVYSFFWTEKSPNPFVVLFQNKKVALDEQPLLGGLGGVLAVQWSMVATLILVLRRRPGTSRDRTVPGATTANAQGIGRWRCPSSHSPLKPRVAVLREGIVHRVDCGLHRGRLGTSGAGPTTV
jgi:hypothetical protein